MAAPEDVVGGMADAAQARRTRAMEEPLDVSWLALEPYVTALVRNPLHGTRYRVYAPDLDHLDAALCTCPDFAHRGAETCKHVEAVRIAREAAGDSPRTAHPPRRAVGGLWESVTSGRAAWGPQSPTLAMLRREGRRLIDPSGRASAGA